MPSEFDYKKFFNIANTEKILSEKACYLADWINHISFFEQEQVFNKTKSGEFSNLKLLNSDPLSIEWFNFGRDIVVFYFYLINIELSFLTSKKSRESFMQDMFSHLMYSIWNLNEENNKDVITYHSDTFNNRYKYYDTFSIMPQKSKMERVENQINHYIDYINKKYFLEENRDDCYKLSQFLKKNCLNFLMSVNLEIYIDKLE